jgi:hypothetical protein
MSIDRHVCSQNALWPSTISPSVPIDRAVVNVQANSSLGAPLGAGRATSEGSTGSITVYSISVSFQV